VAQPTRGTFVWKRDNDRQASHSVTEEFLGFERATESRIEESDS
jgi:hypothetical protein